VRQIISQLYFNFYLKQRVLFCKKNNIMK